MHPAWIVLIVLVGIPVLLELVYIRYGTYLKMKKQNGRKRTAKKPHII